ncbi:glycosyltransferase family 2 protein [Hyphobacterium sp. CCMP332]|nr:glycosyltransferase family 2 protein [Hyphobacterium sp. CCMP332]
MNSKGKISVIMPVFNAEQFVGESIKSVLNQSWQDWELIIINDGSNDQSQSIIDSFTDERIKRVNQINEGVSSARNKGVKLSEGNYICFLDADDVFTIDSLESRIEIFKRSEEIMFVDGSVEVYDSQLNNLQKSWKPSFRGEPFNDLVNLNGKTFFGPTWMIRKSGIKGIQLNESMSHAEDLLYYIEAARNGGKYDYTEEVILKYRSGNESAMKNLKGLEKGYEILISELSRMEEISASQLITIKKKIKYMMVKAYLRDFDIFSAISVYLNK